MKYDRIRGASKIPVYEGFGGHRRQLPGSALHSQLRTADRPSLLLVELRGCSLYQFVTETSYLRSAAQLRQRDWMAADLKALATGRPVIAISHYPLSASWFDQRKAEGINVIFQIGAHYHVVHAGSRRGTPILNSAPARGDHIQVSLGIPVDRMFVGGIRDSIFQVDVSGSAAKAAGGVKAPRPMRQQHLVHQSHPLSPLIRPLRFESHQQDRHVI